MQCAALGLVHNATQRIRNALRMQTVGVADYLPTSRHDTNVATPIAVQHQCARPGSQCIVRACQEHPNRPILSQNHSTSIPPDRTNAGQRLANVSSSHPLKESAKSAAVTEDQPRYQDRPTKSNGKPRLAVVERILSQILGESYLREMNT